MTFSITAILTSNEDFPNLLSLGSITSLRPGEFNKSASMAVHEVKTHGGILSMTSFLDTRPIHIANVLNCLQHLRQ